MDKTGTLTNNKLLVEEIIVGDGWEKEEVKQLTAAYIHGSGDNSTTILAVGEHVGRWNPEDEIIEALPFSSWRQYGATRVKDSKRDVCLLVGAIDIFEPFVASEKEKVWIKSTLTKFAGSGKRLLCVVKSESEHLPNELAGSKLSIVALYVFASGLREGIGEAIAFFQERGVKIRILSGDNAETVKAVALSAGVSDVGTVITGAEMSKWSDADFMEKAAMYRIFARVLPEQKVKIVEALKLDGFTAMVGDGANDALAIRKADLGIAMFDGAQATRQLAAVVLMNNSFTALPGAVRLADSFIQHLEIFSSIFLNQSILGLLFFVGISVFGYAFPFTPLNITPINYFAVGMPGILIGYWALRSSAVAPPASVGQFMKRVLLFPLASSIAEAIGVTLVYLWCVRVFGVPASSTLFGLLFILLGLVFFIAAPAVYRKVMRLRDWGEIALLYLIEFIMLGAAFQSTFLKKLFEIQSFPTNQQLFFALQVVVMVSVPQFIITRYFIREKNTAPATP